MINHYLRLGVPEFSNADTIKKQYRKLAKIYHPDKNPGNAKAEEKFKEIAHSYSVLSDPKQKAAHNDALQGKTVVHRKESFEERQAAARRKKEALRKHEIETRYFKYQSSLFTIKTRVRVAIFMMSVIFSYFVLNYFPNYEKPAGLALLAFAGLFFVSFVYLMVDAFYLHIAHQEVKGNRSNHSSIQKSSYLFIALFFASPIVGSWVAHIRKNTLLEYSNKIAIPLEISEDEDEKIYSIRFFANYESYTCRFETEGFDECEPRDLQIIYYPGDPRLCRLQKALK